MKTEGYVSGTLGEVRAEQHFIAQGFEILARNYRIPGAEIDLIAGKGELIVFAEVKLRRRGAPHGRLSVTPDKQKRISRAALDYLAKNGLMDRQARFDVIEIQGTDVTHIPDAFPYQGPMF
ncbi:MAG: YraN family protein [Clostridia bacterium]|nr:YraN family protein [Clostridia bacterium]